MLRKWKWSLAVMVLSIVRLAPLTALAGVPLSTDTCVEFVPDGRICEFINVAGNCQEYFETNRTSPNFGKISCLAEIPAGVAVHVDNTASPGPSGFDDGRFGIFNIATGFNIGRVFLSFNPDADPDGDPANGIGVYFVAIDVSEPSELDHLEGGAGTQPIAFDLDGDGSRLTQTEIPGGTCSEAPSSLSSSDAYGVEIDTNGNGEPDVGISIFERRGLGIPFGAVAIDPGGVPQNIGGVSVRRLVEFYDFTGLLPWTSIEEAHHFLDVNGDHVLDYRDIGVDDDVEIAIVNASALPNFGGGLFGDPRNALVSVGADSFDDFCIGGTEEGIFELSFTPTDFICADTDVHRWWEGPTTCEGSPPTESSTSYFSGKYWVNFLPPCCRAECDPNCRASCMPNCRDSALLGTVADPTGHAPHYIYFGNWCKSAMGGCPNPVHIRGGDAETASLAITDDDWTFDFGNGGTGCTPEPPSDFRGSLSIKEQFVLGSACVGIRIGEPCASLEIKRGTLSTTHGRIATQAVSAQMTVRGVDALLEVEQLDVGVEGAGTLTIVDGGVVNVTESFRLGSTCSAGVDRVEVAGAGSRLQIASSVEVGHGKATFLRVTDGGFVQGASGFVGGRTANASAEALVSGIGSIWSLIGELHVGTEMGTGKLTVSNEGRIIANKIVVGSNGTIRGDGGVLEGPVIVLSGQVAPGESVGSLIVDGDYEQLVGGVLIIEYEGLNPGEFDMLEVRGTATLGGRLEVHFRGGFSPPEPEAFIRSQFFVEAKLGITGDYVERIYAFPDLFADFDDDGDKDLLDAAEFQNCFGLAGPDLEPFCARADWEKNGILNAVEVRELANRLTGPK
ncbi:MAG: hypothetical protein AABZ47_07685 [Planctomycetota bacterium]